MTTGARQGAWDQLAEALGGTGAGPSEEAVVPPGWDRLRDALTGSGPSQVVEDAPVEDRRGGAEVSGGWAQLRSALGENTAPGAGDELTVSPTAGAGPVDVDPVAERHGGTQGPGAVGRLWATTGGKAAVGVVAAAAVAVGAVLVLTGGGGGLSSKDAFSVGGKVVTVTTFTSELKVRQTLYGITPPAATASKAEQATYLTSAAQAEAVSMLLDQIAHGEGVTVSAQTAQDSLNTAINQQYGGDQTTFANALATAGLNQDDVLTEISHNLVYQKLFAKIAGSPTVTTAQIQQYFTQHQTQLDEPETRQISHIVVSSKASAESIIAQLKAGKPFASLAAADSLDAATKSNGGQLGLYARDDLQASFATAAFGAPLNVPFGPVQDSSGAWDVGVVTAIHPPVAATLNATTSKAIQTVLIDQAEANRWDAWLGGKIKAGHIVYTAAYRPAHPDMPPPIPIPQLTGETLAGVGAAATSSSSSATGG